MRFSVQCFPFARQDKMKLNKLLSNIFVTSQNQPKTKLQKLDENSNNRLFHKKKYEALKNREKIREKDS